ncbi:zinc finger MYM-type protein 1 [Artemisia annua]|uniref:Zinc finger MYM-type protein 1 n=1 Tax=Artemisia annua TaxID=35608 RepID=A0A2U1P0D9_ARTAN|nr:zinc finger MYM-type protein 1 [Artemisia annua]
MRGQGYDNGANMKGKHQGVQKTFLDLNPRTFYTPCGCHSLNLTLCDMAHVCVKGKSFFGIIQRIYTIFANSINRWQILKNNVKGWSLKSLSQTRWESRVESVKAIKLQLVNAREALFEVGEKDNDDATASATNSLAEKELGDFEFVVSIVIWYQLLRENKIKAKEIDQGRYSYPFVIERKRTKNRDQNQTLQNPPRPTSTHDHNHRFESEIPPLITIFLCLPVPFFLGIEDKDLKLSCHLLENALRFEERSDIDADELYMELKLFHTLQTDELNSPIDVLKRLKEFGYFPNATIAYRILLTIPVTVASAERSFSKLKLLKSYLRSTMSQERLSGLAIAIENGILEDINCEELINQFAMKNARRASRIIG